MCLCENQDGDELSSLDYPRILSEFAEVREACPALKKVLVPDEDWESFSQFVTAPMDEAFHQPMAILAFKRRHLNRITSPIHRYLIENGEVHHLLTSQYRQDLRERWHISDTPLRRHQKFRIYMGKFTELQTAEWLETTQRWQILNLAAIGGPFDIEGISSEGRHSAVEMKFIGQSDADYEAVVDSLHGNIRIMTGSLNGSLEYMILRLQEAGRQLGNCLAYRIAAVVISPETWHNFGFQIESRWINLQAYLQGPDYRVDQIWILKRESELNFSVAEVVHG